MYDAGTSDFDPLLAAFEHSGSHINLEARIL
jgi:hypothetical protein